MSGASVVLRPSGDIAQLHADPLHEGAFELSIAGVVQSHVAGDPGELFYDYVRRIGTVIDAAAPPGEPMTALHLGAGALTLVRYVQATRAGSEQHVVEREENLVAFVTEHLPLPPGTTLVEHPGDAAEVVDGLATSATGLRRRCDLIVSDLYVGTSTHPHLRTVAFFTAVTELLGGGGVLVVNVADDDGLPALRALLEVLRSLLPELLVAGPASVVTDARAGNAVVVASRGTTHTTASALQAAGPHPGAVVTTADGSLDRLLERLCAERDGTPAREPGQTHDSGQTREDGAACAADSR